MKRAPGKLWAAFVAASMTATAFAATDYYVDAKGSDSYDGLAPTHEGGTRGPKKTIQAACALTTADAHDVIHVAEGVYDEGKSATAGNGRARFVLPNGTAMIATGRREKTIIRGHVCTEAEGRFDTYGSGPAALRCAHVGVGSVLKGFTLTDGRSCSMTNSAGEKLEANSAGIHFTGSTTSAASYVIDCTITNCYASYKYGGATYGIWGGTDKVVFIGSHIVDCSGMSSTFANATAWNCIFDDASGGSSSDTSIDRVELYNCDVLMDKFADNYYSSFKAWNCLITATDSNKTATELSRCILTQDIGTNTRADDGTKKVAASELKLDANRRPLPGSNSPLLNAGNDTYYTAKFPSSYTNGFPCLQTDYAKVYGRDYTQEARFSGSAIDIGAVELTLSTLTGVGVRMTGKEDLGNGQWRVTFTQYYDSPRLLAGIEYDGASTTFPVYEKNPTWSKVVSSDPELIPLTLVYSTADAWYVNGTTGNDANNGYSPFTAFKKISKGFSHVSASGTVHVARGTYTPVTEAPLGVMTSGSNFQTNTVMFPSTKPGVGLIADEGYDVTFIEGNPVRADRSGIRCVQMPAKDQYVKGFTIRNGGTYGTSTDKAVATSSGAGVFAWNATNCKAVNCRFSGNKAGANGGAACYVDLYGCVVDADNESYGDGAGGYYAYLCNCVMNADALVWGRSVGVVNCTFNNCNIGASSVQMGVYNSIFYGKDRGWWNYNKCSYHKCVFITQRTKDSKWTGVVGDDCVDGTSVANYPYDATTFAPLAGSKAIDAGNGDYYALMPADVRGLGLYGTDATAGQRVYNAALDIGAVEHDWRPDFAAMLNRKGALACTAATSGVCTNGTGVALANGESMSFTWTCAENETCNMVSCLTGGGTLSVTLDGVPVAVSPAGCSMKMTAGTHTIVVTYAGSGTATVSRFRKECGLILLVR